MVLVAVIVVLSVREWMLLLGRRKPAVLCETEPVWLPDYAVSEGQAAPRGRRGGAGVCAREGAFGRGGDGASRPGAQRSASAGTTKTAAWRNGAESRLARRARRFTLRSRRSGSRASGGAVESGSDHRTWSALVYSAVRSIRSTWVTCWWRRRRGRNWSWRGCSSFRRRNRRSSRRPSRRPAPERLRLLRLALAGKTWCEIDEQEIQRGGVSYTIDTVRDYARRFPRGAALLPDWRGSRAAIAEVARGGGTGAAGGVRGHPPARAGGDAVSRAVSRAAAGGLSAGRFLLADSRAGEGRPADRPPGAGAGGRGDPQ